MKNYFISPKKKRGGKTANLNSFQANWNQAICDGSFHAMEQSWGSAYTQIF